MLKRISTWHVVFLWLAIVISACYWRVRVGLDHTAATNEPEVYVHDPAFQVISFFWVYGLPLLALLGLMIFATNRLVRFIRNQEVIQPDGLISVLLNRNAPLGDRLDAAMDLAGYDNAAAIDALTKVKEDPAEDEDVAEEAGHSLLMIGRRRSTD